MAVVLPSRYADADLFDRLAYPLAADICATGSTNGLLCRLPGGADSFRRGE